MISFWVVKIATLKFCGGQDAKDNHEGIIFVEEKGGCKWSAL